VSGYQQKVRNLQREPRVALSIVDAVFRDGFTLQAAEAISQFDTPLDIHPFGNDAGLAASVITDLMTLVDASLIQPPSGGATWEESTTEPRYTMLETVRDYAVAQLQVCGEMEWVKRRHMEYMLQLATSLEPQLWGPRESNALAQLYHF
jgi:predicted ATPase